MAASVLLTGTSSGLGAALFDAYLQAGARVAHMATVRVVYVTTHATGHPYPGWATYCATKAAAELLMRCAEVSARPACTVHIVDPGGVDTPMHAHLRRRGDGLRGHDRLLRGHADGLLADPVDVAHAIVAQTLPAPSVRPVAG